MSAMRGHARTALPCRWLRRGGVAPVAAFLLVLPSTAQQTAQAPQQEALRTRSESTRLKFAEEVELRLLLQAAASAVSTPIEFDPEKLAGTVHMQPDHGYTAAELWEQVNRELRSRGLTTVQPPDSVALRVVPVDQAAATARLEDPNLSGAVAGFVRVLRPLEHRLPKDVLDTVRLLVSQPTGSVAAAEEARALLISDFLPHVAQALRALNVLDAPDLDPGVVEVPLEHTTPVALGALVERLVQGRKAVTGKDLLGKALPLAENGSILVVAPTSELEWWQETIRRFDRPEPVVTVHYTPRRFGLAETAKLIEEVVRGSDTSGPWRAVTDRLTGSLVVTTTPSRHEAINDLLNRLERTEAAPGRPMRAYPIHHRRVAEVLALLEGLVEAGALDQPARAAPAAAAPAAAPMPADEPPQVQGATAPIPTSKRVTVGTGESRDAEVTLTADEGTNRLIAFGEARLLDQLDLLIESLDVRNSQVLVEALVVILNETQTRALGVELQKIGSENGTLYALSSLFGLGSPPPGLAAIPAPTAAGGTGVVLDPGEFSAIVRALETVSDGRSLSIPKVLVSNNQEAVLDSTVQSPFASTNASNTVATTTFGGTFDAGTSITVKPQVADADQILLDYTISLSRFVGAATSPDLPPPRQENRLHAVATIPDGSTVVVGGLELDTETEGEDRVPWIGSIPLIGNLFKSQTTTKTKSRFFVFLRCNVMRSDSFEDLRFFTAPELAAAGVDDDWPRLEPRVMR